MARIRYSGLVQDISGSIGGTTFQRNAFGSTIRSKPTPVKSLTASQQASRVYMSQCITLWNGLSVANRALWDRAVSYYIVFSKFNKTSLLTGRALFIKYNLIRLRAGLSVMTTFDYLTPVYHAYTWSLNKHVPNGNYLLLDQDLQDNNHILLARFSLPLVATSRSMINQTRVCRLIRSSSTYYFFATDYRAIFGADIVSGQYCDIVYRLICTDMPAVFQSQSIRSICV